MNVSMVPTICNLCWNHCAEEGGTIPCPTGLASSAAWGHAAPRFRVWAHQQGLRPHSSHSSLSSLVVI